MSFRYCFDLFPLILKSGACAIHGLGAGIATKKSCVVKIETQNVGVVK